MSKTIERNIKLGLLAIFVIIFAYATFNDLAISKVVVNETNIFGQVMEDITAVPFAYTLLLSGCIALGTCKKGKGAKEIVITILCGIYYLVSIALSSLMVYAYLPIWTLVIHLVGVILLTIFAFRIDESEKKNWQKIAIVCGIVSIGSVLIIESLKLIWGRVRPRALDGRDELFTTWFTINGKKFLSFVHEAEEIKSFPSGHSQWGAVALCYSLIPLASKKFKGQDFKFMMICLAWGVLVMLGRISVGAHFVTDAMAGFSITALLFILVRSLVFRKNN